MKIKIGDKVYDAENEPIALVFGTDKERQTVAKHLTNMEPKDSTRVYVMYPDTYQPKQIEDFIKEF